MTKRYGSNFAIIATFDLETEKYGSLPQPHYSDTSSCMLSLGVLGGKLCVNEKEVHIFFNYDMRYIDLWVMEKYGVKKSWIKILSVAPSINNQFMQLKPLAYSNNGKKVLLLKDAGQLIWYDLELKVIKKIRNPGIPEFWKAWISMESLVKLNCDAITALPWVQKKTKKRILATVLMALWLCQAEVRATEVEHLI
ncbi:F-box protein CPR1-like [Apium graveolens]|uniref:F-box protein CPR1-like n=1 Tax=Apium graveolens TaxID=4045 RepID=UPI003D7A3FA5